MAITHFKCLKQIGITKFLQTKLSFKRKQKKSLAGTWLTMVSFTALWVVVMTFDCFLHVIYFMAITHKADWSDWKEEMTWWWRGAPSWWAGRRQCPSAGACARLPRRRAAGSPRWSPDTDASPPAHSSPRLEGKKASRQCSQLRWDSWTRTQSTQSSNSCFLAYIQSWG